MCDHQRRAARFRIKKKQRILNLERSLNDLKGRAKDLEGEAAELRRENGWLKEIVMLKGASATHVLRPLLSQTGATSRSEDTSESHPYPKNSGATNTTQSSRTGNGNGKK